MLGPGLCRSSCRKTGEEMAYLAEEIHHLQKSGNIVVYLPEVPEVKPTSAANQLCQ